MASIRKRVRNGKDGVEMVRWLADYTDQFRARHTKTFTTRKAAQAWLIQAQKDVVDGVHSPERGSITLAAAAALWFNRAHHRALEPTTLSNYMRTLEKRILPDLGKLKLMQLTVLLVEAWSEKLLDAVGAEKTSDALAKLRAILDYAVRRNLVQRNVAALAEDIRRNPRDDENPVIGVNVPTREEFAYLLAVCAAERTLHSLRPLLLTAVLTAMRQSELLGLARNGVDFEASTITIYQRARASDRDLGQPKSRAARRVIIIGPLLREALREWWLACPKGPESLLFPNSKGRVRCTRQLHVLWARTQRLAGCVDAAGKPKYKFHMIRHYSISRWLFEGIDLKRVEEMAGHKETKSITLKIYGHAFPERADFYAAIAKIEREIMTVDVDDLVLPERPKKVCSLEEIARLRVMRQNQVYSAEQKAKRSAAMKGRVFTDEWRAKISAAKKGQGLGRTHSAETRAKIAAGNRGKTLSAETRAKISAARRRC
jgi:integrase